MEMRSKLTGLYSPEIGEGSSPVGKVSSRESREDAEAITRTDTNVLYCVQSNRIRDVLVLHRYKMKAISG
jgi:hypothetical protein